MRYLATALMTGALLFIFRFLLYTKLPLYGVVNKYDVLLLMTFLAIFGALSTWIVNWIWKNKKENLLSHILLVIVSAFVLVLPMTKISNEEISKKEDRYLAVSPRLIAEKGVNYEYGKQFESWLNDRFRGREKALNIHSFLEYFLSGRVENNQAMEGKEGWLFYKGENSVKNFQNRRNFTDKELRKLKEKLEKKRDYCASFGARYYVLIAPDKNKVYGEFFPDYYYKINPIGRGEQLYRYLKKNSNINVVYPLSAMMEAKKQDQLYYKNDTHWNPAGAFVGYQELMKVILQDYSGLQILSYSDMDKKIVNIKTGDLLRMLNLPGRQEGKPEFTFKEGKAYQEKREGGFSLHGKFGRLEKVKNTNFLADRGRVYIITDNPKSQYSVFVFRDSFTIDMVPFLSQQFGHVEYLWTRDFFKNTSALREKSPDIVIEEVLERRAGSLVD